MWTFVFSECFKNVLHFKFVNGPVDTGWVVGKVRTNFPYENKCVLCKVSCFSSPVSTVESIGTLVNFLLSHTQMLLDWVETPAVSIISTALKY